MSVDQDQCGTAVVDVGTVNLTSVPLPEFDLSVLGAHAFNLTCDEVQLRDVSAGWLADQAYSSITQSGFLRCHANLTAYAYSGLVLAHVDVFPSEVRLLDKFDGGSCSIQSTTVDSCDVNASVTALYSEPPTRLIDLLLEKVRADINDNTNAYVCKVLVPRVQASIVNSSVPCLPPRGGVRDDLFPVADAPLIRALMSVASEVLPSLPPSWVACENTYRQRCTIQVPLASNATWCGNVSLVPAAPSATAVEWAQGLVDAYLAGSLPDPFPLYGLPEGNIDASVSLQAPSLCSLMLDVDAGLQFAEGNYVDVLLNPGVSIANMALICRGSLGNLITHELMPRVQDALNAKLSALLAAAAAASPTTHNKGDNTTVRVSFGNNATVRNAPLYAPLVGITVLGLVAGVLLVRRNLRRHAGSPVLSVRTGAAVSVARLVAEDVLLIGGVVACLLLFAASNTMTGATVVLGREVSTYSFSLSNTVADLWSAGLKPLSVCVLLFSGIYPYVKLVSILVFTVWANRPGSRVLMLIDCIGKFSLLDTFALMVMASGLEIRGVAEVAIHRSFFMFMGATLASIALGNYATQLWRVDTTVRLEDESVDNTSDYAAAATTDAAASGRGADRSASLPAPAPVGTVAPVASAIAAEPPAGRAASWWRRALVLLTHPALLMLACSVPAWLAPCLRYTVGGFARLLTPTSKSMTLYALSTLNGRTCGIPVFVVTLLTTLVAPCLHVLLYPHCAFLASWCAADAFIVACVAGLLQLHQFVTFVLGSGMDDVYTAHAALLWPMAPLAAAALLVWVYVARDIAHGGAHAKRTSGAAAPSPSA